MKEINLPYFKKEIDSLIEPSTEKLKIPRPKKLKRKKVREEPRADVAYRLQMPKSEFDRIP